MGITHFPPPAPMGARETLIDFMNCAEPLGAPRLQCRSVAPAVALTLTTRPKLFLRHPLERIPRYIPFIKLIYTVLFYPRLNLPRDGSL